MVAGDPMAMTMRVNDGRVGRGVGDSDDDARAGYAMAMTMVKWASDGVDE